MDAQPRSAQSKGNIGEVEIAALLTRLTDHVASVVQIPQQQDHNHQDISVHFRDRAVAIRVQVKYLTGKSPTLRLESQHIRDWLEDRTPTFVFVWIEPDRKAFWLDPIVAILSHSRGIIGAESVAFPLNELNPLESSDIASVRAFVDQVRGLCELWPDLRTTSSAATLMDSLVPVSLFDILRDPILLSLVPIDLQLKSLIVGAVTTSSVADPGRINAAILAAYRRIATGKASSIAISKSLCHVLDLELRKSQQELLVATLDRSRDRISGALKGILNNREHVRSYQFAIGVLSQSSHLNVGMAPLKFSFAWSATAVCRSANRGLMLQRLVEMLKRPASENSYALCCHLLRNIPSGSRDELLNYVKYATDQRKPSPASLNPLVRFQLQYTKAVLNDEEAANGLAKLVKSTGVYANVLLFNQRYYNNSAKLIAVAAAQQQEAYGTARSPLAAFHKRLYTDLLASKA